MLWKESGVMDARLEFVRDALSDRFTKCELCGRYGVRRRIGYEWLARYDAEGRRGLANGSRAPHHCSHKVSPAIAQLLIAEREAHPHWGGAETAGGPGAAVSPGRQARPAASTVADLLARRGLVQKRRLRRPSSIPTVQGCDRARPRLGPVRVHFRQEVGGQRHRRG